MFSIVSVRIVCSIISDVTASSSDCMYHDDCADTQYCSTGGQCEPATMCCVFGDGSSGICPPQSDCAVFERFIQTSGEGKGKGKSKGKDCEIAAFNCSCTHGGSCDTGLFCNQDFICEKQSSSSSRMCQEFTFSSQSTCFPADQCTDCSYVFNDGTEDGTKDFGNIHCGHHNLFFSEMEVTVDDLPMGFKFTCDHPDSIHFGLQTRNNRQWNLKTWHIEINNLECHGNQLKIWTVGNNFSTPPNDDGNNFLTISNDEVVVWIRADRQIEYYNEGILQTTGGVIDESNFPLDFVISPPFNNYHGFLRSIGYVSDPSTGKCIINNRGMCEEFTFTPQSACFPADQCTDCRYDFNDGTQNGTKDFGNIYCGYHNLFFSEMEVTVDDLPMGFKFTCDHPDNLHFGLQTRNNRQWNLRTWRIEINNLECKGNHLQIWSVGNNFAITPNDEVVIWIRADRQIEYYNNGILQTTGSH